MKNDGEQSRGHALSGKQGSAKISWRGSMLAHKLSRGCRQETESEDKMCCVVSHWRPVTTSAHYAVGSVFGGNLMTSVTGNPWEREEFTI